MSSIGQPERVTQNGVRDTTWKVICRRVQMTAVTGQYQSLPGFRRLFGIGSRISWLISAQGFLPLAPLDLQIPKRSKDTREVRQHDTIHRMAVRYSLLLVQWDGTHETSAVRTLIRSLVLSQLTPCDFERHVAP